jgi:C-terminal processing protease CtpA/Prc
MKRIFYILFCGLVSLTYLSSCGKDDPIITQNDDDNTGNTDGDDNTNKEENPYLEVNEWIEEVMRSYYLWYSDIPAKDYLNYKDNPETFFTSLLSSSDGRDYNGSHQYFSYIENTKSETRSTMSAKVSLGFEYQIYILRDGVYAMQVLYIVPNSPAAKSAMKRGDWIMKMGGSTITLEKARSLATATSAELGIARPANLDELRVLIQAANPVTPITKSLNAEQVDDNPVYADTVFTYNNLKIGYLVYNAFEADPDENNYTGQTYNNTMRKAFSKIKSQYPDEFILDLRYNSGGLVSCAQLLATLLAPESAMNQVFGYLTYNNKHSDSSYSLKFDPSIISMLGYGANLNLSRLYVITSSRTASASEAVINSLRPFLGLNTDLILVGETTVGKNVGSITIDDDKYDWVMHPIVCRISNKDNVSDYVGGFAPTFPCVEPYTSVYDLADTREYILNQVLDYITTGKPIKEDFYDEERSTGAKRTVLLRAGSSLDRKGQRMVLAPNMMVQ